MYQQELKVSQKLDILHNYGQHLDLIQKDLDIVIEFHDPDDINW